MSYIFLISVYSGYCTGLDYGTPMSIVIFFLALGFNLPHWSHAITGTGSLYLIFNIQGAGLVPPRSEYAAEYP